MAKQPRAGGIIQRRTPRVKGWTKARKTAFLAGLAESCNVMATCRALGLKPSSAYQRRARDAEFARQWEWALQQGYVRLETELLQRAIGDAPVTEAADAVAGHDAVPMSFDADLALKLLAQRAKADSGGRRRPGRVGVPTTQEVLAALDRKLTAMEKRMAKRA